MAINLEMPKKLQAVIDMAHEGAAEMLRPISRKYDQTEHAYPIELDTLAELFQGMTDANTISFAGADAFRGLEGPKENVNGANMSALVNALEISFGTAFVAAAVNVVFGTLVAWVLVRYRFPGRRIVDAVSHAAQPLLAEAKPFALVVQPAIRIAIRKLVRTCLPDTPVLSFFEVPEDKAVEVVAVIGAAQPAQAGHFQPQALPA